MTKPSVYPVKTLFTDFFTVFFSIYESSSHLSHVVLIRVLTLNAGLISFVILQGVLTSNSKEIFSFAIFKGGSVPPTTSGSAHESTLSYL